jgi:hypothetical protein
MTAANPKSVRRLSSLFSLSTHDSKGKGINPQSPDDGASPRGRSPVGGRITSTHSHPSGRFLSPSLAGGEEWGVSDAPDPAFHHRMAGLTLTPPPPVFAEPHGRRSGSRPASPISSRPGSRATSPAPHMDYLERPETPNASKRRSWMPSRSRNPSQDFSRPDQTAHGAWVKAGDARLQYDLSALERAQKVG